MVWRAFLEMMLSRERLSGMVVAAFKRMAGQYLGGVLGVGSGCPKDEAGSASQAC